MGIAPLQRIAATASEVAAPAHSLRELNARWGGWQEAGPTVGTGTTKVAGFLGIGSKVREIFPVYARGLSKADIDYGTANIHELGTNFEDAVRGAAAFAKQHEHPSMDEVMVLRWPDAEHGDRFYGATPSPIIKAGDSGPFGGQYGSWGGKDRKPNLRIDSPDVKDMSFTNVNPDFVAFVGRDRAVDVRPAASGGHSVFGTVDEIAARA
jgi:hypothetical protein